MSSFRLIRPLSAALAVSFALAAPPAEMLAGLLTANQTPTVTIMIDDTRPNQTT